MGTWKGTTPPSSDADWSHTGVRLKYHSDTLLAKKLDDGQIGKIKKGYELAVANLGKACELMKSFNDPKQAIGRHIFKTYFKDDRHVTSVHTTLILTLNGMKDVSKNRIYINDDSIVEDKFKKAGQSVEAGGYVKSHAVDEKDKKDARIAVIRSSYRRETRPGTDILIYNNEKTITSSLKKQGQIHMTRTSVTLSIEEIAHTLIHEATHRFAGTADVAYRGETGGTSLVLLDDGGIQGYKKGLSGEHAINNADSYAAFCMEIGRP